MHTRTRRQKDVLEYISRYITKHGHEPSYQIIARELGLASKAGIAKHVKSLEEQGLLKRKRVNGSFSLEICTNGNGASAVCEVDWVDAFCEDGRREDFETRPMVVPAFMIRPYEPERMLAFRICDDAMVERGIHENDIALIERRSFVRDGECIVATVKNKFAILRSFYRSGSSVELHPSAEDYEIIKAPADKIEVNGIFRCLLRPAI
jgi:repressor LexA